MKLKNNTKQPKTVDDIMIYIIYISYHYKSPPYWRTDPNDLAKGSARMCAKDGWIGPATKDGCATKRRSRNQKTVAQSEDGCAIRRRLRNQKVAQSEYITNPPIL